MTKLTTFTKRLTCLALAASVAMLSTLALADTQITGTPATWRMQDYLDGNIVLYYTGSSCADGYLVLIANTEPRARFWSLLLTAAANNKSVGVLYNPSTCYISNFYSI